MISRVEAFLSKEKLKLLLLFALKFIEIQHEWEREIFRWLSCRCWNSIDCGCWLKRFETFHANVHMMLGSQARPPRRLFLFLLFETFPIMYGTVELGGGGEREINMRNGKQFNEINQLAQNQFNFPLQLDAVLYLEWGMFWCSLNGLLTHNRYKFI